MCDLDPPMAASRPLGVCRHRVPKTIDNDIDILDRTFGFDTACSEALKAINTAYVEATCNANCIGLVKLMGRR